MLARKCRHQCLFLSKFLLFLLISSTDKRHFSVCFLFLLFLGHCERDTSWALMIFMYFPTVEWLMFAIGLNGKFCMGTIQAEACSDCVSFSCLPFSAQLFISVSKEYLHLPLRPLALVVTRERSKYQVDPV